MEETTYGAQLTLAYTDMSTRNVSFTDVDVEALPDMADNIIAFNAAITAGGASAVAYQDTFISNDGAPIARISKAKYTATTEEVIYSGN